MTERSAVTEAPGREPANADRAALPSAETVEAAVCAQFADHTALMIAKVSSMRHCTAAGGDNSELEA